MVEAVVEGDISVEIYNALKTFVITGGDLSCHVQFIVCTFECIN